jgi:hypothetical protein
LKGNEGDWAFSKSIVWSVPECMSLDCKLHGAGPLLLGMYGLNIDDGFWYLQYLLNESKGKHVE